jgi:hypothetical protein
MAGEKVRVTDPFGSWVIVLRTTKDLEFYPTYMLMN